MSLCLVHTRHQSGLGHIGIDDLYHQSFRPYHLVFVGAFLLTVLLPLILPALVLLVAPLDVGHDVGDRLVDATLARTRRRHQTVHQRRLVIHIVGIGEAHAAEMRTQRRKHRMGHRWLIHIWRPRCQQADQLRQLLRQLRRRFSQHALRVGEVCRRQPATLREQFLLILQQALVGVSVVLVEVVHQLLDVLVLPVIGHQHLQHTIGLGLRQQLRSTTEEYLHRCMPAALIYEVAPVESLLLHHPLSDKPAPLIRLFGFGGLVGTRRLPLGGAAFPS